MARFYVVANHVQGLRLFVMPILRRYRLHTHGTVLEKPCPRYKFPSIGRGQGRSTKDRYELAPRFMVRGHGPLMRPGGPAINVARGVIGWMQATRLFVGAALGREPASTPIAANPNTARDERGLTVDGGS